MRKKRDTYLSKSLEDLKFEIIVDNFFMYDIILRRRPT